MGTVCASAAWKENKKARTNEARIELIIGVKRANIEAPETISVDDDARNRIRNGGVERTLRCGRDARSWDGLGGPAGSASAGDDRSCAREIKACGDGDGVARGEQDRSGVLFERARRADGYLVQRSDRGRTRQRLRCNR